VGNKVDLSNLREVSTEEAKNWAAQHNISFIVRNSPRDKQKEKSLTLHFTLTDCVF
jgi:hypothetical protein